MHPRIFMDTASPEGFGSCFFALEDATILVLVATALEDVQAWREHDPTLSFPSCDLAGVYSAS